MLAAATAIVFVVFEALAIRNGTIAGAVVLGTIFGSFTLGSAAYARGVARAGLMVTRHDVVIRNPWRTRRIPISNALRFSAGTQPAYLGNPTPGVLLERKDGRPVPVWTLAREGLVWNTRQGTQAWIGVAENLTDLLKD
jgi:hypothetical protein